MGPNIFHPRTILVRMHFLFMSSRGYPPPQQGGPKLPEIWQPYIRLYGLTGLHGSTPAGYLHIQLGPSAFLRMRQLNGLITAGDCRRINGH